MGWTFAGWAPGAAWRSRTNRFHCITGSRTAGTAAVRAWCGGAALLVAGRTATTAADPAAVAKALRLRITMELLVGGGDRGAGRAVASIYYKP